MANIPQVYLPGKSGVGVGVGYKHGQSAIAVGYSQTSDNSKHIAKLSIGADSQKDVTVGAGTCTNGNILIYREQMLPYIIFIFRGLKCTN